MTELFREPFANLSRWTVAGSSSIVAGGRNGTGAQCLDTISTLTYNIPAPSQTNILTIGFAYKEGAIPSAAAKVVTFGSDSGATEHNSIKFANDGSVGAYRALTQLATSAASVIAINTWYYIELMVLLDATVGQCILKVNGTQQGATFNGNTKNAGTKTVYDYIQLLGFGAGVVPIFDDVYLRNDSTISGDIGNAGAAVAAAGSLVDIMYPKLAAHYPAMTNRSLDDFLQQFATDNPTYLRPWGNSSFYTQTQFESLAEAATRWWTAYVP